MPSLKERVTTPVRRVRDRHSIVDHTLNTVTHYRSVGGEHPGAPRPLLGFLSFFPILRSASSSSACSRELSRLRAAIARSRTCCRASWAATRARSR